MQLLTGIGAILQYSCWFLTFMVLALIYKMLEKQNVLMSSGKKVFLLFHLACIPAYFLSVLWHQPSIVFNIIGEVAAVLQFLGAFPYFVTISYEYRQILSYPGEQKPATWRNIIFSSFHHYRIASGFIGISSTL